jgi:hypothetical protein
MRGYFFTGYGAVSYLFNYLCNNAGLAGSAGIKRQADRLLSRTIFFCYLISVLFVTVIVYSQPSYNPPRSSYRLLRSF